VANLERHDGGRTWKKMFRALTHECGYDIRTEILSPHHFGIPQIRDRLFIVGCLSGLEFFVWPSKSSRQPNIREVLDRRPSDAQQISEHVSHCLSVWNDFLQRAPKSVELPSFPIWGMEFGATYPYTKYDSLYDVPLSTLRHHRGSFGRSLNCFYRQELLERVPSHARSREGTFPRWKQNFIRQNREFFAQNKSWIKPWLPKLMEFHSSLQKLEWNCKGEARDIWQYVVQFRASGVRIKRAITAPSLVAMTTTQVPIIAWERRYMTPRECCRLQSLDVLKHLPDTATATYKALGNAVNARLVEKIAKSLLHPKASRTTRETAA
jgi:DNA (cytosine-5)-methyltransferase 1